MCWSVGKSKSSNCLQLSLQIPATDSKTHMLLRDLWEVLILFDISVHPICLAALMASIPLFRSFVFSPLTSLPAPCFKAMTCQKCYLEIQGVMGKEAEVILLQSHTASCLGAK